MRVVEEYDILRAEPTDEPNTAQCNVEVNDNDDILTKQRTEYLKTKSNFATFEEKLLVTVTTFFGKMNNSIEAATAIMGDIEEILNVTCNFFVAELKSVAMHFEIESKSLIMDSLTHASNSIKDSLKKLNTEHKVKTLLTKRELLQMPSKRTFNEVRVEIGNVFETVKSEVTILPIEFQIKKFLELPSVLETILHHQEEMSKSNTNEYTHFLNAKTWKKVKEKFSDKDVIPIFLYNDDFCPDDSLSPHGQSTKLSAFYYK